MSGSEDRTADRITIGIAQMAPVWMDREATLTKVCASVDAASHRGCRLVAFGETLVPGYPFWIGQTDGARFDSPLQKEIHSSYVASAVRVERGDLQGVCDLAATRQIAVVLGCVECPADRGGHSLYASAVFIDASGTIQSVHRKLMPTYEERLTWSPGDGHGLRVHPIGPFTAGALNCWENWMPLARASLHALGEDLHVALWPGGIHNTQDITRFAAREGRSFVVSAAGLMRRSDFPDGLAHREEIVADTPESLANGGSCVAGPDGQWVVEPVVDEECLIVAELDHARVREERQNFDASGHYARPDVTRLIVDRRRQRIATYEDPEGS